MPAEQTQTTETQTPPAATPAIPAGATLPTSTLQTQEVQVTDVDTSTPLSDADWGIFDKSKPTPNVNPDGSPKTQVPSVEKREEQKQPEAKKPEEKPAEQKAPTPDAAPPANEGDELPDLDKLDDNVPKTHKALVKQRNKLGKELRLSREKEGQFQKRIDELQAKVDGATSPEKEAELQKKLDTLTADLDRQRKEADTVRDELYARDVEARPEYQEHFVKPFKQVVNTLAAILKKVGLTYKDFEDVYTMSNPDDRDNAFVEMMGNMTAPDQIKFELAKERIPGLVATQKALQANSKERLEQYRQADQQKQEREREGYINTALSSSKAHYEALKAQMPYLYEPEGDTPEVKNYRDAVAKTLNLSEQIAKRGVDKLSPEIQGRMVHDAVFADFIRNNIGGVLKQKDQQNADLQSKVKELEATVTTLQDEVDSYRGAIPGGGGLPSSVAPQGADTDLMTVAGNLFPHLR